jgi:predicted Zn-dependent protease
MLRGKAFDRDQEAEADHIGLFLMTFAGYDPGEAVHLWNRMQQISAGTVRLPEILSDHPSDARRIRNIADWVPRALAAKRAFDEGRIEPARNARRTTRAVFGWCREERSIFKSGHANARGSFFETPC